MILAKIQNGRRGASIVEFAFVVSVFVLLFFGMMEFCFLIYTYNVVENAAREGAHHAVVHYADSTLVSDAQDVTKNFMSGLNAKMKNYSCSVYMADANGNNIGAAADTQFGQLICVDVSVDYVPMTPGLGFLKTITLRSKCSMASEAN